MEDKQSRTQRVQQSSQRDNRECHDSANDKTLLEGKQPSPSETELLWRQYALHVDLYKQYLDLVLRFNIFYYAITGGILSFFFSQQQKGTIRYSLLFPMIMSIFFSILAFYAAGRIRNVVTEINRIKDGIGITVAPDVQFLAFILRTCGLFFILIYIGLMLIFVFMY
jgi:hypothetical protein